MDSKGTTMVKDFTKLREYFFCAKKKKLFYNLVNKVGLETHSIKKFDKPLTRIKIFPLIR